MAGEAVDLERAGEVPSRVGVGHEVLGIGHVAAREVAGEELGESPRGEA